MNDARLALEEYSGQDWQRGIFRADDLDGSGKRMAAMNKDFIHTSQPGNVSHLNNRTWNKCRGNSLPPGPKKAHRFGRFRSLTPAIHRAEAATAPAQSARAPAHRPVC